MQMLHSLDPLCNTGMQEYRNKKNIVTLYIGMQLQNKSLEIYKFCRNDRLDKT
jgi:hypothetical protein